MRVEDPAERVMLLLKKVWSNSQTRMAAEIGMSQSAISNVVTRRQQPGRKLLAAIAAHPLVNANWLLTGDGDPIVVLGSGVGCRALYVAERLFGGRPEDHGDCLGTMVEVPTKYYRPTRYWVEISPDNILIRAEMLKIAVGDFVLFEPDRDGWPTDICGHPCIVTDKAKKLQFAWVTSVRRSTVEVEGLATEPITARGKPKRAIDLGRPKSPRQKETDSIMLKSVVAVGVYRCGPFGRHEH